MKRCACDPPLFSSTMTASCREFLHLLFHVVEVEAQAKAPGHCVSVQSNRQVFSCSLNSESLIERSTMTAIVVRRDACLLRAEVSS